VKIPAPVQIDRDFWMRRRVLVTGHTGFKGSWLCLWLQSLGACVTGLSPGVPTEPSLYGLAEVGTRMRELAVDVRDARAVREAVALAEPEVIMHLAAQPMVRRSLRDPVLTYEVNVMGTVNVLEAVRAVGGAAAVVVVTSDKCYENRGETSRRFVEDDPLGGADPYSSSKACAELVTAAYRRSFFAASGHARLATARAGNVIGGGDWGEDRLLADIVRAVQDGRPLLVRNPHSVRPWQHVLSPLAGYMRLAEGLCRGAELARAWNFGPREGDEQPVSWIVSRVSELWGGELEWELDEGPHPAEAGHLTLDSGAAERDLGWRPACDLEGALGLVVAWHRAQRSGQDMRAVSLAQIERLS
jgi:CDP-glucose 4,6-dehydratase